MLLRATVSASERECANEAELISGCSDESTVESSKAGKRRCMAQPEQLIDGECDFAAMIRPCLSPSSYTIVFLSLPQQRLWNSADCRMNWSGAALATFYSAVRHALVVAIVIRALGAGLGIAGLAWAVYRISKLGGGEL